MPLGLDSRAAMTPNGALEGFGNLGSALLLAPQQARQRQAQEAQAMDERAFRDRQLAQALQMHREDLAARSADRQVETDYRNATLGTRQMEDFGTGLKNALSMGGQAVGAVMGVGGKKSSANSSTGWHKDPDGTFFRTAPDGRLETYDPKTKKTERTPAGDLSNAINGQGPAPVTPGPSALTMRRSGVPGVHTIGDVTGGRWFGDGDAVPAQAPAPDGAMEGAPARAKRQRQPINNPRRYTAEERAVVMKLPMKDQQELQHVLEYGSPESVAEAYARLAKVGAPAPVVAGN